MNLNTLVTALILFVLLCIITSLGMGLYYLVTDRGKTKRTVKALSVRIILSFLLFIALILAFAFGLISPHPLYGTGGPGPVNQTAPNSGETVSHEKPS